MNAQAWYWMACAALLVVMCIAAAEDWLDL
jgi:hypothetical protein